jgi:hypothetical protein
VKTVDLERHGSHLNAKGKEKIANRISSVINDLFRVNSELPIALKWKENEDMDSFSSVNKQTLGDVSGRENKVLL